jgi:hypothetical protein
MGGPIIKYERRSRADVKKALELDRDIKKASDYVFSLAARAADDWTGPRGVAASSRPRNWAATRSATTGLDPSTFVFYLVDVSGHGAGAAMHSSAC